VQGWLYSALWPLREEMAAAVPHLERGDATWRHGSAHLEWLRDPRHHLGAAGRVNLDDLITIHGGELGHRLEHYAASLAALAAAATDAQGVFERVVKQISRERRLRDSSDDVVGAVAADLVNDNLDGNRGAEGVLIAALRDELPRLRASRPARLDDAYREAAATAAALLAEIDDVRRELCDACDLPPAPITVNVHGFRGGH
jgi:hypothetical protein